MSLSQAIKRPITSFDNFQNGVKTYIYVTSHFVQKRIEYKTESSHEEFQLLAAQKGYKALSGQAFLTNAPPSPNHVGSTCPMHVYSVQVDSQSLVFAGRGM